MKVKMLTTSADARGTWAVGQVVQVDPNEGMQLIQGGYAVAILDEATVNAQVENASLNSQTSTTATSPARGRAVEARAVQAPTDAK